MEKATGLVSIGFGLKLALDKIGISRCWIDEKSIKLSRKKAKLAAVNIHNEKLSRDTNG